MVVDTSIAIAIFKQEFDAEAYTLQIGRHGNPLISAATLLEIGIVLSSWKRLTASEVDQWIENFLQKGQFTVVDVTRSQAKLAREAYARFGKGSGHPAQLNFGDCFTYALAKERGAPVLFKGDDFRHTDLVAA
ncbi:type II toxin-antitoxin system VapC family toxin [Aerophototrophica crusticola]